MDALEIIRGATWDPIVAVLDMDGNTPAAPDDVVFRLVNRVHSGGTQVMLLSSGSGITIGARVSGEAINVQMSQSPTETAALVEGIYTGALWFVYGSDRRPVDDRIQVRVRNSAITPA